MQKLKHLPRKFKINILNIIIKEFTIIHTIYIFCRTLKDSDIKNALKELEKKYVKHSNVSHVKRLLKITMSMRRKWIETEFTGIVDIVTKYPSLEHYEIVHYVIDII